MRYRRLQTLGFAALLATITAIHCIPTEVQADRRRRWTTYGSASGHLVVACDMRSSTCSDGRQITTTRATPVPCETSPGVWEIVPEDEGCYSVRGLESWAANTSYLSWGAELDRSPWTSISGGVLEPLPVGWLVRRPEGAIHAAAWIQLGAILDEPETWTLSCIMRAGSNNTPRLRLGSAATPEKKFDVTESWDTYTFTGTVPQSAQPGARIYPGNPNETTDASVGVKACWLTRGETPGRPCWGGEAPVTCAADSHTISTDGWPTESGSISVAFQLEEFSESFSIILDARTASSSGFNIHYGRSSGRLFHRQDSRLLQGPTVETGRPYFVELRRKGPKVEMLLNGVLVASDDEWPPWSYSPIAVLGRHFLDNLSHVNGSISSLRIRSK